MARARNIKPALFKNELLGVEDPIVTLLFIGLWSLADRDGKLEDRPLRIKAEIFPYRELSDFNGYLTVLERLEFICRYTAKNQQIIKINNFKKHQSPHKTEKSSELPEPEVNQDKQAAKPLESKVTVNAPLNNHGLTGALPPESLFTDSLNPDLLITDSLNPDKQTSDLKNPPSENVKDINSGYAFYGEVIKLNQKDFKAWSDLYANLNLEKELTQLDMELRGNKNWFQAASAKLNYRNKNELVQQKKFKGISTVGDHNRQAMDEWLASKQPEIEVNP